MEMQEVLKEVNQIVANHEGGRYMSLAKLQDANRRLGCYNYRLTVFNIDYFEKHNTIMYNFKGSVGRGKIIADEKVPEIRMLRKIMKTIESILWNLRDEISVAKKEI